ncbi:MAG: arylsulfatase [Massilibacteroides sp.]|nr:arylsulfatase [Massilibacteroides sp.]
MKKSEKVLLTVALLGSPVMTQAKKTQTVQKKKPNVIIVITDDQGKNDLACEGNPYIKTPHIDTFYGESVRFTNFHVSTTSAPSRSSIMTGRHTDRLNCYHTIAGRSIVFGDEVFLPQILAQNGYRTGMFGKWHLGDNYPSRAMDKGFQTVVRHGGGGITQTPDYWNNDYFDDFYWTNGTPKKYTGYCTDVFFHEAMKFIKAQKDKDNPFFCYLSTNAPHGPHNVPLKYLDMYSSNTKIPASLQRMYGMITNIDDNFKILRDNLEEWGLAENTILIFMTDNGTAGGQKLYTAGMKGQKGSEYEGGHRTPFYIKWPAGHIGGGKDINRLTAHYDILPTLIDLIGLHYHSVKPLDGKSWVPLLKGQDKAWKNRILFMDTQRKIDLCKYKQYSVMDDNWRLVNGNELYDMRNDLAETHNVYQEHPEVAARLAEGYEKWWSSILSEKVDQRFAYIIAGTKYENPVRLTAHDLHTGKLKSAWNQNGVRLPQPVQGVWKIQFATTGTYKISLRRFPRVSGLGINAIVPAQKPDRRFETLYQASTKNDFTSVFLNVGSITKEADIKPADQEISFIVNIPEGKYDMEAQLIDREGRVYPAYYTYVEKLD